MSVQPAPLTTHRITPDSLNVLRFAATWPLGGSGVFLFAETGSTH